MLTFVLAAAAAFNAPIANAPTRGGAVLMQRKGGFWQRADWQAASEAAGLATAAAAPAPAATPTAVVASMGVPAACKFMESNPDVTFAEKKAFLLGKGVSEFVIAEAACTAPDTTLVL